MDFCGKTYKFTKSENYEDFVKSLELPAAETKELLESNSIEKLEKNGDHFVMTSLDDGETEEIKFKSGVEFDEKLHPLLVSKSTITVESNKLTHVQKYKDDSTITYVREYSPSQMVETITCDFWSGVAKRFYTAQ